MAPSFFPRRLCRPTCRAHRARGGWKSQPAVSTSTSGRRNPGIVPWTSVPWTYSHSVNTSGSRVLRLRRSTRSKASRRSIMLLQVLRRLDRLRFPCRIIHSIGVVVPHRNLPERRPRTEHQCRGRSPGTTCRSIRRLRDSQNTCCLMGGRASLPVAADRRRGARSGR